MANGATRSGSGGTDRPAATPTRYVVVGAGAAGVIAAETLRRADPAGDVVLVNGEGEQPYARMAIPYVLTGEDRPKAPTCGRRPVTTTGSAFASSVRRPRRSTRGSGRCGCRTGPRCLSIAC